MNLLKSISSRIFRYIFITLVLLAGTFGGNMLSNAVAANYEHKNWKENAQLISSKEYKNSPLLLKNAKDLYILCASEELENLAFCSGYIQGFRHGMNVHDLTLAVIKRAELIKFCIPDLVNNGTLRKDFLVWSHTERNLNEMAPLTALIKAWQKNYPCTERE